MPRRGGPYLQFLINFASFDVPKWRLFKQVDEYEQLYIFASSENWNNFSKGNDYLDFVTENPIRAVIVHKYTLKTNLIIVFNF